MVTHLYTFATKIAIVHNTSEEWWHGLSGRRQEGFRRHRRLQVWALVLLVLVRIARRGCLLGVARMGDICGCQSRHCSFVSTWSFVCSASASIMHSSHRNAISTIAIHRSGVSGLWSVNLLKYIFPSRLKVSANWPCFFICRASYARVPFSLVRSSLQWWMAWPWEVSEPRTPGVVRYMKWTWPIPGVVCHQFVVCLLCVSDQFPRVAAEHQVLPQAPVLGWLTRHRWLWLNPIGLEIRRAFLRVYWSKSCCSPAISDFFLMYPLQIGFLCCYTVLHGHCLPGFFLLQLLDSF